jgi:DNA-binding IclR family transcriptional regulator
VQTLARHGFVRQDPATQRYQAGVKLFILGERLRDRFDVLAAARKEMAPLRDETGQAVTVSALVEDQVLVLELLQGRTIVEFGTRPGTVLDLHASAHGKVALASVGRAPERSSPTRPDAADHRTRGARAGIAQVTRAAGPPPNEVPGVNALAAPIFDHRGAYAGALAIVGSTQYIAAAPTPQQITLVTGAAQRISRELGFRSR